MLYKTQPKQALAYLFKHGGGPLSLSALLDAFTSADTDRLRQAAPIRELIEFTKDMAWSASIRSLNK